MNNPGFLGTGATLLADITLVAYVLLILPGMLGGLILARLGKHRPHHKYLMITVTSVNWVLIIFLMAVTFFADVAGNVVNQPGNARYLVPAVHTLFGLPAQILATFIVIRMLMEDRNVARAKARGEQDTQRYWFKRAKPIMRLTLALWLVTATFGVVTYLVRYDVVQIGTPNTGPVPALTQEAPSSNDANAPVATEDSPGVVTTEEP